MGNLEDVDANDESQPPAGPKMSAAQWLKIIFSCSNKIAIELLMDPVWSNSTQTPGCLAKLYPLCF